MTETESDHILQCITQLRTSADCGEAKKDMCFSFFVFQW